MFTPEDALQPEQKASALPTQTSVIAELESADEYVIRRSNAQFQYSLLSSNFGSIRLSVVERHLRLWGERTCRVCSLDKKATIPHRERGECMTQGSADGRAITSSSRILRTILGFIGITNVTFVTAGGTAQLMSGTVDRGQFLAPSSGNGEKHRLCKYHADLRRPFPRERSRIPDRAHFAGQ